MDPTSADRYASWMNNSRERLKETIDLMEIIKRGDYNAETLKELIHLLDHEYMSEIHDHERYLQNDRERWKPYTGNIVTQLSSGLFEYVYPECYYQRELKLRSLLSALALQRAQKTSALESNIYETLREGFQELFRQLQMQQSGSGPFTREKFREAQCSYLLCASAESAKYFDRAQPWFVTAGSRAMNLVVAAGSLALATNTGWGPGSLASIIQAVDGSLRRMSPSPDERYATLFRLQEISRIALAFHRYARVSSICHSPVEINISDASQTDATRILKKILARLRMYGRFEENVSRPPYKVDLFRAFLNRGPPHFSAYYYIYGLLDCAAQLARILDGDRIPQAFEHTMEQIIAKSKEPSFRWKAIECLLSADPQNRLKDCMDQWRDQVDIICECLFEEEGLTSEAYPPSDNMVPPHRGSTTSKTTVSSQRTLVPQDWMEDPEDFKRLTVSSEAEKSKIQVKGRRLKGNRLSGLSPDCNSAFFLSTNNVIVYSLINLPAVRDTDILLDESISPFRMKDAATITNMFLAIIVEDGLTIFQYRHLTQRGSRVHEDYLSKLHPTCLAMHEAGVGAWISVGGRSLLTGHDMIEGRMEVFRVDGVDGKLTLTRHTIDFNHIFDNDFPKMVNFSPCGDKLLCLTKANKFLVWSFPDNTGPPFQISKTYTPGTTAQGMEYATLFKAPSGNEYVLFTTSPSNQRASHGGEWPFISPVTSAPSIVPKILEHSFYQLKRSKPILAGATSEKGHLVVLLEDTGTLILFTLTAGEDGGLQSAKEPVRLTERLWTKARKSSISTTCLRLHDDGDDLYLFAVHKDGTVIKACFPPA